MILLIWAAVLVAAIVLYLRDVYSVLDKYGIKFRKPVPLLGNMWNVLTRKCHMAEDMQILYQTFPEERFTGKYDFLKHTLLIHDLELIKQITVKDFENFLDHGDLVDEEIEPCFGRSLFSLKGQEWKDMRSTLSPAFTSSKMRSMFPFMVEVSEQMLRALQSKIKQSPNGYIDIECKDVTTKYTNDVIATCAFGVKLDSYADENNKFYTLGKGMSAFGFKAILAIIGHQAIPRIAKALKFKMFPTKAVQYFGDLVINNMKERELRNIFRPDMVHLLMQAKKGKLRHEEKSQAGDAGFSAAEESTYGTNTVQREWSDNDIFAQTVIFFVAGFETVSTVMSFLLYELARNPEVQDRLLKEIQENEEKNGEQLEYNSVQNLKYFDMVVSEILRLWPPAFGLNRVCLKDYNIGKPNADSPRDYIIRKNETVLIPVWPFHRDARYFPNPEKFDPERFSDENKRNIKPFTYMPFGSGPRNCIGSRFALTEVKVMAYHFIQNFEVSPCEKTPIHPTLDPNTFNMHLKGGIFLRISPRK